MHSSRRNTTTRRADRRTELLEQYRLNAPGFFLRSPECFDTVCWWQKGHPTRKNLASAILDGSSFWGKLFRGTVLTQWYPANRPVKQKKTKKKWIILKVFHPRTVHSRTSLLSFDNSNKRIDVIHMKRSNRFCSYPVPVVDDHQMAQTEAAEYFEYSRQRYVLRRHVTEMSNDIQCDMEIKLICHEIKISAPS